MSNAPPIDVRALIDAQPLGRFQWLVVALGFCVIALDGFDTAIMGFIAPEVARVWGIGKASLGPVLSAALIGLAIGALVAGPLADRFGRKVVLVTCVFFFGAWTLASAFAPDQAWLMVLRFLTGLGLGASMPNAGTLVSEYAPQRHRSILVTVVFCGFTFGASVGGFAAAWLIPHYGWRSVLALGGVLPLAAVPLLMWRLPESARFLAASRAPAAVIRRVIDRLAPGVATERSTFVLPGVVREKGHPIRLILSREFALGTLMLWVTYFMGLFLVYLMGSWLPTLVGGAGFSVRDAALVTALFQFGGTAGSLFLGWRMDRGHPHRVLALTYLTGGVLVYLIGVSSHGFGQLALFALGAGFCLNGANTGMNALATRFYPTAARATGASWMHGIGRWGAISSAFAGAQMLAAGWSFAQVFAALTVPAAIGALAVFVKGRGTQPLDRPAVVQSAMS
ncbi:aromatic acid/H+ symport family MFS transporter [Ralstonia solanacearum]|uniref:MFS transporter n=1 Tax=Ralstonia syzygii TaxID=28097 RepID=A0ABX7ZB71_9RALS|nr:MFS transporter [Ralstonia syzygii]AXW60832.1 aromatic acid/H+ symport family MFS transporter [Ralstonia solanacearum]QUP52525.1 MFS transporter [Ralstonia syzygii]